MRRFLLFVLPILLIVTIAFVIFGVAQVRYEQSRSMDDLHRRAQSVAEGVGGDAVLIQPVCEEFYLRGFSDDIWTVISIGTAGCGD